MNDNKEEALNELQRLEESQNIDQIDDEVKSNTIVDEVPIVENNSGKVMPPNIVDGYKILDESELPLGGILYPISWRFAYRCPTTKEIANFSTVRSEDGPAVIAVIEDLIRKCVKIYDVDTDNEISSDQINDSHRVFFLLKLREFYLPGKTVQYPSFCTIDHTVYDVNLTADKLEYHEIEEKWLNCFDGRVFTIDGSVIDMPELKEPIIFHIPTLNTSSRLYKYIVNSFRDKSSKDRENKSELSILRDKKFLLFASFLFQTGKEPIKQIVQRYKELEKNDTLFKAYFKIINKLKFDALESIAIDCPICGSEEVVPLSFPEYENLFVD